MKFRNLSKHKIVTNDDSRILVQVFMFWQTVKIMVIRISIILHHWSSCETPHRSTIFIAYMKKGNKFLKGNRRLSETRTKVINKIPKTHTIFHSNEPIFNSVIPSEQMKFRIHQSQSKTLRGLKQMCRPPILPCF